MGDQASRVEARSIATTKRWLMGLLVALGPAAGCVERALPFAGGLDCAAVSFDPGAPSEVCATGARCDITGTLADGRSLRESCTKDACALFVDGVQACSCPAARIDYTNTCPNGLPTCAGWLVNYVTIDFCGAP